MSERAARAMQVMVFALVLIWSFLSIGILALIVAVFVGVLLYFFPALGRYRVYGLTVGLLIILPFVLWNLPHAERLDCEYQDVDIASGKVRISKYFWHVPVSIEVKETEMSKALSTTNAPDWRRANLFIGSSGVSPHYAFHGAMSQVRRLERVWEYCKVPAEFRRKQAAQVIAAWKQKKSYFGASDIVSSIEESSYNAQP